MMISFLYIVLAVLGLSVLIFFHELGHYYMARRVGMKVEAFGIGFGKPIYSWERDGVRWQIGWLPFGGFVKIAGEGNSSQDDPYEIPDGYFGKRPIDRIKMLFAGPFVNLALAFVIFSLLWFSGGREKNFSEFTHKIGWVDPHSELYQKGIRPGDEITAYNGREFHGVKDHLYGPMTSPQGEIQVTGYKVDYTLGERHPFDFKVKTYSHPGALDKGILTAGVLAPANYIIYNKLLNGVENPLPEGSSMKTSGIQYGDRILWVDGEIIFSGQQLNQVLNDSKALLTIERNGDIFLKRVPRVPLQELRMDTEFREELTDWQFEAELNNIKFQKLLAIPYNLTADCVVEGEMRFIDKENQEEAFPTRPFSSLDTPLIKGDRIIAVDGTSVKYSFELLALVQQHLVNVIVERDSSSFGPISTSSADEEMDRQTQGKNLAKISRSIGTSFPITSVENFYLLRPILPKTRTELVGSPEGIASLSLEVQSQKKEIESIEDPEKRAMAFKYFHEREKQLLLGLPGVQDRKVEYNPNPITQFINVFEDIWRMLVALFTGSLNPKWMSGPIGIVQVVHDNWMVGIKEALFWLGAISLNLGVLNLLPIPVLDGGSIVFALFEMITGKKIPPKTLEKLIIPFALILILFFIFLTYQDLSRIFGGFLR